MSTRDCLAVLRQIEEVQAGCVYLEEAEIVPVLRALGREERIAWATFQPEERRVYVQKIDGRLRIGMTFL